MTHKHATAAEIANWKMPEATPAAVKRAEELGRQLAPKAHSPEKRKVVAKIALLRVSDVP